jgi:DNA mismatch endonuclease (patch repair protein)
VADNLTKEQRSKTMSRIRRRDTKPEKLLRQAAWRRGLRGYRLDDRRLPGRPDLAWTRTRVAVFIDGAFWHGHPKAFTPGKSGSYWDEKIARNIARDREADAALRQMEWTVLRFWDFEVTKDCEGCVATIETAMARSPETTIGLDSRMRPRPPLARA